MKRAIALLLALVMVFALCGCNSKEKAERAEIEEKEAIQKEGYDAVKNAYGVIYDFSDNVYEVWRMAEYDVDGMLSNGVDQIVERIEYNEVASISKDQLVEALCRTQYDNYDELSDAEKKTVTENVNGYFKHNYNHGQLPGYCVWSIMKAYEITGYTKMAEDELEKAKAAIKLLGEKYPDSEYYSKLKELYIAANALFEFCKAPTGSFKQYKTTENEYKNTIRDCMNTLDLLS